MKKINLLVLLMCALSLSAQNLDSLANYSPNSVETMINNKPGLGIGGYGEVHYNQPLGNNQHNQGTVDVHRMVMFLGYNFSSKTQFVSELEFEYAKEIWVEQMFLQHKLFGNMSLRAGLLLVPMGIINEYHEPTTFNGVERPIIDNRISPSTWREIGMGITGSSVTASMKYQLYLVNGFNGYDQTGGLFSGSKSLREGRQKGSKAYMSVPALTGKVEYFGLKNLNIGLSGYFGQSHSRLYNGLNNDSTALLLRADSSVIGISMIGADMRYNLKGLRLTGQFYYLSLDNTDQYNVFTAKNNTNNDLGSSLIGYYAEIGYNVFQEFSQINVSLMPFLRYEVYNTHNTVGKAVAKNEAYNNTMITTGLTYMLTDGAALKTDMQFLKSRADSKWSKTFNAGIAVMF